MGFSLDAISSPVLTVLAAHEILHFFTFALLYQGIITAARSSSGHRCVSLLVKSGLAYLDLACVVHVCCVFLRNAKKMGGANLVRGGGLKPQANGTLTSHLASPPTKCKLGQANTGGLRQIFQACLCSSSSSSSSNK